MKYINTFKKSVLLGFVLCLSAFQMLAQQTITGKVTSAANGDPLIGVNVIVKGTSTGTITDFDGNYSVSYEEGNTLVFSYVGFISEEVEIGGRTTIDVALSEGSELDEVVVTALGISREKKALGYAVEEVSGEDISNTSNGNIVNSLRGRVSGVQIQQSSGAPGSGVNILIRGINSLDPGRSNSPLYIIDGIEVSDDTDVVPITSDKVNLGLGANSGTQGAARNRAVDINPDDIASISVLKGASATALYGIRAANGAIVITTKKGQAGEPTIDINYGIGWENPLKLPKVQQQFIDGHRNDSKKRTWIFYNWGSEVRDETEVATYDIYDEFFQTGVTNTIGASLSAGNDRFKYRLGGNYFDTKGIIPNSDYTKTNFTLNASYDVTDRLNIEGGVRYTNSGGNTPHEGRKSTINNLLYTPNIIDVTSYEEPYTYDGNFSTGIIDHALFLADNNSYIDDVDRVIASVKAKYDFTSTLSLNYAAGTDFYADSRTRSIHPETDEGHNMHGFVTENSIRKKTLTSNLFLNWNTNLSNSVSLNAIVGQYLYSSNKRWVSVRGENLSIDNFFNLNNASDFFQSNADVNYRNAAVYGELTAGYNDFLYLTVAARNDWSSSLPKANRSYFFPSFSLSWVLSDMVDLPSAISFAKLRASYAVVGKDASAYSVGRYFGVASNFPFGGVAGYGFATSAGDKNLKPEFSTNMEFGADLKFLNNRLGVDVAYYQNQLDDMILSVPVSNASGASRYTTNAGSMKSTGVELLVYGEPVRTKDFSWYTAINWSTTEGTIEEISADIGEELEVMSLRNVTSKYVVGGKIGDLYGIPFNRVGGGLDGALILDSTDGLPRLNRDTSVLMGNAFPDWIANWTNEFTYKGIGLSFLWEWKKGGKAIDVGRTYSIGNGQLEETNRRYESVVFDGVIEDADGNYVENTIEAELHPTNFYRNSTSYRYAPEVYLQDASWIRLRSLSLSYSLPQKVLAKTAFKNIKFTLTGNNLFLNTPFKGFDPELNYFGATSNIYGYTGLRTPSTRSYMMRVNLTF